MIKIICALITTCGVVGAAIFAYLSAKKTIQANKDAEDKRRQEELNIKKAEDLNRIIFPALQSLEITTICKDTKYSYHQNWLDALILDRAPDVIQRMLRQAPKNIINDFDTSIIITALNNILLQKNDLYEFMLRYNDGTIQSVDINLVKLNKDLTFINETLGKNYKLFDIRPEK
jgi:hypothetical protein